MALEKFTKDMAIIQALDDEPNDVGGLTASELKAKFDEGGEALKTYINTTLFDAFNDQTAEIEEEVADREEAVAGAITTTKAYADGLVSTEKSARESAVSSLNQSINAETTARTNADTALSEAINAEKELRKSEDDKIYAAINEEATNRDNAISTAVSNEVTARNSAINSAISSEEVKRDAAISTSVSAESTARTNADNALGGRIDAEASSRSSADSALGTRIDNEVVDRNAAIKAATFVLENNGESYFTHDGSVVTFAQALAKLNSKCNVFLNARGDILYPAYYDNYEINFAENMLGEDGGVYTLRYKWHSDGTIDIDSETTPSREEFTSQSVEIAKLQALGLFIDADGDVAQHDYI